MKEIVVYKNKYFRAVLDIYTPRPHFILLLNHRRKHKYKSVYDFPQSLWQFWIKTIHRTFKKFGPCIFSIHLGFFQSKDSPYFHAHYFVPLEKYLDIFIKRDISPSYLDKLLKWGDKIRLDGKKYKKHDLKQINKIKVVERELPKISNYTLQFHESQPRVAFIKKGKNKEDLYDLVWSMMEFIYYYGLHDRKVGGCHLCLQNNYWVDNDYNGIIGYLQIDIINYYKINPNRKEWLKNFRKSEYLVIT